MGRQYTPFGITVHHTREKTGREIQEIIDEFYMEQVKLKLQQLPLSQDEKSRLLSLLAHSRQAGAADSRQQHKNGQSL